MTEILISLQEAIEAIESVPEGNWKPSRYIKELEKLDPVQQERKKGKWIDHQNDGYVDCPFCGALTTCSDGIEDLHFCFSCGAELEGEQDE